MPRLTLAERFLITRRRMQVTQVELAGILRISRGTVIRIERNQVDWRLSRRIIDRFEILEKRQRQVRRENSKAHYHTKDKKEEQTNA